VIYKTIGQWQQAGTAPKDGTPFLSFDGDFITIDIWDRGNRVFLTDVGRKFSYPTHWMPLPAEPGAKA
tara:strand:- start:186 stop:389 length:204 start_codon:yes stop_codon:yes gene_type:complete